MCTTNTGHAEVVRVEFDPRKLSYKELVEFFFKIHNPAQFGGQGVNIGDQYRSVIFFHSDEQRDAATKIRDAVQEKLGKKVATQVVKGGAFYMAEEYHQQFYVKSGVAACPIPVVKGSGGR